MKTSNRLKSYKVTLEFYVDALNKKQVEAKLETIYPAMREADFNDLSSCIEKEEYE